MEFTGLTLYLVPQEDWIAGSKVLDLPLYTIDQTSKYILKNAENLSAGDQSIILGDAYGASTFLQHMAANPRDIILRIGLNPNYAIGETPGSLRTELYTYMSPVRSRAVRLNVVGDDEISITGYISKMESDVFSQSTDVYVTIKCSMPFFRTTRQILTSPVGDTINQSFTVDAKGTAFTAFIFEIWPNQPIHGDITISADTTPEQLKLTNIAGLITQPSYDTIHVRTDVIDPHIIRRINGSPFEDDGDNLINYLTYDSNFFVLPPGQSTITIDLPNPYTLNSLILVEYYWGV